MSETVTVKVLQGEEEDRDPEVDEDAMRDVWEADDTKPLLKPGSTDVVRLVGLARPPERLPDMGECR